MSPIAELKSNFITLGNTDTREKKMGGSATINCQYTQVVIVNSAFIVEAVWVEYIRVGKIHPGKFLQFTADFHSLAICCSLRQMGVSRVNTVIASREPYELLILGCICNPSNTITLQHGLKSCSGIMRSLGGVDEGFGDSVYPDRFRIQGTPRGGDSRPM
jgi:hypothetical protein